MTRTRSEYRAPLPVPTHACAATVESVNDTRRDDLAHVLLDAYRGTVDDEGETLDDAFAAIDYSLAVIDRNASVVLTVDNEIVAFAFVVEVGGVKYIDPVCTAPAHKQTGLGRAAVAAALGRLDASEAGAAITDGNTASERLFASLGFVRVGPWPPNG